MKKLYLKPNIETVEVEYETLMLPMSGEQGEVGTGDKPVGDEVEGLSSSRRDSWGSLWN